MSDGKPQGDNQDKDERDETPHDVIMNVCIASVKCARVRSCRSHKDDQPSHPSRLPGQGRSFPTAMMISSARD